MSRERMLAQANNTVDFQLHTLGWKAFQDLCSTVASEILGQTAQQFLPIKDAGRDGAFVGYWNGKKRQRFVIQCKFFSDPNKAIRISHLKDELPKARRLTRKGLCDRYLILSNGVVTGANASAIEKEFSKYGGPKRVTVYGKEWLTEKIRESSRLRALVPRIYGLGDLSLIIDQRAIEQARELLSAIQDELGKFVITKSYRQAARAIMDASFVFLLGEPACGKSMTAACLSVASLDQKHSRVFKLARAAEFHEHWNPKERSLFWFDDVFGPTQYERDLALEWVRYFPELAAAVRAGNRVIFTSRSYIYDAAIRDVKAGAFPLLRNSQVVIKVEDLSSDERKQILYNHVKLGNQAARFRSHIKPMLSKVSESPSFQPEIARRLGNSEFTRTLDLDEEEVQRFVEEPKSFLVEVVESLDTSNLGALTLLFLSGGALKSPLKLRHSDRMALDRLGVSEAEVARSLNAMKSSLTKLVVERSEQVWRFKHPTIADAVAEVIARNPEYIDIYLRGAKPADCLREIVCGDIEFEGAKLWVGKQSFPQIFKFLEKVGLDQRNYFISNRCDKEFLTSYLKVVEPDDFLPRHGYLYAVSGTYAISRLHELELLPEETRKKYVAFAAELAEEIYDFSFMSSRIVRQLFSKREIRSLVDHFAQEFLPHAKRKIEDWGDGRNRKDDARQHYDPIREGLSAISSTFPRKYVEEVKAAESALESAIESAASESYFDWDQGDNKDALRVSSEAQQERDIFDDIDE